MSDELRQSLIKVPQITFGFWLIKILATTLGETGGDTVSMSLNLGYLVSTGIFLCLFIAAVIMQIKATRFHPTLYWVTIIASTTVGTTLADFADRSLGIDYLGGTIFLASLLVACLCIWYQSLGSISVSSICHPKAEAFYWLTIMLSQTLGTALGDWTADSAGLGYVGAAIIFSVALCSVSALYFWTSVSRTILFWSAFVLTRPLGAVVGDYLDKPIIDGGLALSRFSASFVLVIAIGLLIIVLPQRAALKRH